MITFYDTVHGYVQGRGQKNIIQGQDCTVHICNMFVYCRTSDCNVIEVY